LQAEFEKAMGQEDLPQGLYKSLQGHVCWCHWADGGGPGTRRVSTGGPTGWGASCDDHPLDHLHCRSVIVAGTHIWMFDSSGKKEEGQPADRLPGVCQIKRQIGRTIWHTPGNLSAACPTCFLPELSNSQSNSSVSLVNKG